jgi:D-alanyl-D-alanine carboxypeptidase
MALSLKASVSGRKSRVFASVCLAGLACATLTSTAEARGWRHNSYQHQTARHHYARAYRPIRHHWTHRAPGYSPPFAAMVVDANSGRTLYAADENGLRHPASITKVMTLYLLFEQLEKGRMTLETPIEISAHAASQAPSKLGLPPGDSLSTEEAIKAVVTRSANDVAVAIAEKIGGDEETFAEMMTRKAHALGMSRTVYHNASGLPDDRQVTTARDLTILARAVEERFPRYFHYFSTHSFAFAGETIGNHNHLLGRIDGVDGIKTGYTNASGFNLLTSMHRDGRSLVAVVLGGRSAEARDRMMEQLLYQHFAQATSGHSAQMIAEANAPDAILLGANERGRRGASPAPTPPIREAVLAKAETESFPEGDDDETVERAAATPPVRPAPFDRQAASPPAPLDLSQRPADIAQPVRPIEPMRTAALETPAASGPAKGLDAALPLHEPAPTAKPEASALPLHQPASAAKLEAAAPHEPKRIPLPEVAAGPLEAPPAKAADPAAFGSAKAVDPATLGWVKGPDAIVRAPDPAPPAKPEELLKKAMTAATHPVEETRAAKLEETRAAKTEETKAAKAEETKAAKSEEARIAKSEETRVAKVEEARPVSHEGWKIQIAATDDADKANDMLSRARAENRSTLALAKPFTEKVQKGDATLYRARFAVLDASAAEAACRSLKRTGFSCFATRD